MANQNIIERAIDLAESGRIESVSKIRAALVSEGYSYGEIGVLFGSAFKKQLAEKISATKAKL